MGTRTKEIYKYTLIYYIHSQLPIHFRHQFANMNKYNLPLKQRALNKFFVLPLFLLFWAVSCSSFLFWLVHDQSSKTEAFAVPLFLVLALLTILYLS